jgi:hypothetical protein
VTGSTGQTGLDRIKRTDMRAEGIRQDQLDMRDLTGLREHIFDRINRTDRIIHGQQGRQEKRKSRAQTGLYRKDKEDIQFKTRPR